LEKRKSPAEVRKITRFVALS